MANFEGLETSHRIRRLIWRMNAADETRAMNLRKFLSDELLEHLLPALEATFDQMFTGPHLVRISQLKVCFSAASVNLDEIMNEVRQQISAQLSGRTDHNIVRSMRLSDVAETSSEGSPTSQSLIISPRSLLLRYLESGVLPWELSREHLSEARELLIREAHLFTAAVTSYLDQANAASLFVRFERCLRWLQLLSSDLTSVSLNDLISRVTNNDRALRESPGIHLHQGLDLLQAALVVAMNDAEYHQLVQGQLEKLVPAEAAHDASLAFEYRRLLERAASSEPNSTGSPRDGKTSAARQDVVPPVIPDGAHGRDEQEALRTTRSDGARVAGTGVTPVSSRDDVTGQIVPFAGLVLLHPFLPRFLESIGTDPGGVPSLRTITRAATALHWLATGRWQFSQLDLGLIQVLLGRSPGDIVMAGEEPEESETSEASRMLTAVVHHWSALGQTSIHSLQTVFLQRNGLLRFRDGGYHLRVESTAYDVLLTKLPWSISLVKFPWMKHPLFVEWPMP